MVIMASEQTEHLTAKQVAERVEIAVRVMHGQDIRTAATAWGCSPQFVHMVIKGQRPPNQAMLDALNLVKEKPAVTYRRRREGES